MTCDLAPPLGRPAAPQRLRTGPRLSARITIASATPSVCVVGGGVIGLTSALRLLQRLPAAAVTIIAEKVATETTSEGAAGLWKPYAITGTDPVM